MIAQKKFSEIDYILTKIYVRKGWTKGTRESEIIKPKQYKYAHGWYSRGKVIRTQRGAMHAHPFIRTNCTKQRAGRTQWNVEAFHEYSGTSKLRVESSSSLDRSRSIFSHRTQLTSTSFCSIIDCRGFRLALLFHGCHGCVHVTRHCQ